MPYVIQLKKQENKKQKIDEETKEEIKQEINKTSIQQTIQNIIVEKPVRYNREYLLNYLEQNKIILIDVKINNSVKQENKEKKEQKTVKRVRKKKNNTEKKPTIYYTKLMTYINENSIILLEEYDITSITSKSIVTGKCKTENCEYTFSKKAMLIIDGSGPYCELCTKNRKIEKSKETCIERYGVENPSQCEEIKEKMREHFIETYGGPSPFCSKEVKQKCRDTMIERYSVEYSGQSPELFAKAVETNNERYGKPYTSMVKEFQEKKEQTVRERYGGVKCSLQNLEVKQKSLDTIKEKYGTDHPMQNPEIAERSAVNALKIKEYTLPSGKILKYQGYENLALDELLKNNILEDDIINSKKDVPCIKYILDGKERRYFVDIFIKSQNKMIEVKSVYFYRRDKEEIIAKMQACIDAGYLFELWIYGRNGKKYTYNELDADESIKT